MLWQTPGCSQRRHGAQLPVMGPLCDHAARDANLCQKAWKRPQGFPQGFSARVELLLAVWTVLQELLSCWGEKNKLLQWTYRKTTRPPQGKHQEMPLANFSPATA